MKIRTRWLLVKKTAANERVYNPSLGMKVDTPLLSLTFQQVDIPPEPGIERFWDKVDASPQTGLPVPVFISIVTDQLRLGQVFVTGQEYDWDFLPAGQPGFPAL